MQLWYKKINIWLMSITRSYTRNVRGGYLTLPFCFIFNFSIKNTSRISLNSTNFDRKKMKICREKNFHTFILSVYIFNSLFDLFLEISGRRQFHFYEYNGLQLTLYIFPVHSKYFFAWRYVKFLAAHRDLKFYLFLF